MRAAFQALLGRGDVVLSTGGVSVGRHDAVHRTWLDLGARRIVGRVDLKPGGPFFAARAGDAWAVGLSGTPVACLAAFHLLVQPLVLRLAGRRCVVRPVQQVTLVTGFPRATDRMRALWARVEPAERGRPTAEVLPREAVGDLAGLLSANALVLVPPGTPPLPPGSRVAALVLDRDEHGDRLAVTAASPGPMVVGVVGESGGGKTTVLVDLVRRLAVDGIRAVAVKHAAHGFDPDHRGSDSARMAEAGAGIVVLAGPTETVLRVATPVRDRDRVVSLVTAIAEEMWGEPPALVLIEGFQHPSGPVIQVGPQKPGWEAGEVLATVPAVARMDEAVLAGEVRQLVEVVRSRVRSDGGRARAHQHDAPACRPGAGGGGAGPRRCARGRGAARDPALSRRRQPLPAGLGDHADAGPRLRAGRRFPLHRRDSPRLRAGRPHQLLRRPHP